MKTLGLKKEIAKNSSQADAKEERCKNIARDEYNIA